MNLAQNRRLGHAAIVELQNAIGVAAMRNILVAGPYGEARMPDVDKKGRDLLAGPLRGLLLARSGKQDDEVRVIGAADEMLGAVNDEVPTRFDGSRLHAAKVGAGAG